jgi:hypothetical protein
VTGTARSIQGYVLKHGQLSPGGRPLVPPMPVWAGLIAKLRSYKARSHRRGAPVGALARTRVGTGGVPSETWLIWVSGRRWGRSGAEGCQDRLNAVRLQVR